MRLLPCRRCRNRTTYLARPSLIGAAESLGNLEAGRDPKMPV